jgi:hypothetical protein
MEGLPMPVGHRRKVLSNDIRKRPARCLPEGPAFHGASFGEVGPSERIEAIARFAVEPASPRVANVLFANPEPQPMSRRRSDDLQSRAICH